MALVAITTPETPSLEASSVTSNEVSAGSHVDPAESHRFRSVKDYRTLRDLRLALTFSNASEEQRRRQERGEPPILLRADKKDPQVPELQRFDSSDEELNDLEDTDVDTIDDGFHSDLEEQLAKEEIPNLDWVVPNLNKSTSRAQSLDDELYRLKVLRSYFILDNKPELCFDRLTTLGARFLQAPMCLVTLVDLGRIWFVSCHGSGECRTYPRNMSFCAHANMSTDDLLVVPDATKDARFMDNFLVCKPPHVRYYAGAPLISPEGVRLGTFCVLDIVARPHGVTADERKTLLELAAMTVTAIVDRRDRKINSSEDKAKMIACTAHDLLTPLSGVQMSVNLLKDDENLVKMMDSEQRDTLDTADNCSKVLAQICHETIDSFRNDLASQHQKSLTKEELAKNNKSNIRQPTFKHGHKVITVKTLVKDISVVMDPYPKSVPLYVSVHSAVPAEFVSNELKLFRCVINFLTNACKHTEDGCVHLKISMEQPQPESSKRPRVLFQVEDTGNGVSPDRYATLFRPFRGAETRASTASCKDFCGAGGLPVVSQFSMEDTPGLGLYSVATNVGALGGDYGFRPRTMKPNAPASETGSTFWFNIPYVESPTPVDTTAKVKSLHVGTAFDKTILCKKSTPLKKVVAAEQQTLALAKKIVGGTWSRVERRVFLDLADDEEYDNSSFQEEESVDSSGDSLRSIKLLNKSDSETSQSSFRSTESWSTEDNSASMAAVHDNVAAMSTIKPLMAQPSKRVPKILIIDDSLVVRKSLARAFVRMGYEAIQANNGSEGFAHLKTTLFDVVLCDFLMPIMDGLDCVQQYRQWEGKHRSWFRQCIIGMSAHADKEDVERAVKIGMDGYQNKPLPLTMVKDLVANPQVIRAGEALDHLVQRDARLGLEYGVQLSAPQTIASTTKSQQKSSSMIALIVAGSVAEGKRLSKAVKGMGWNVVVAQDGNHALIELSGRHFDAVLMDDGQTDVVAKFRQWERINRVTRQSGIVCLSRKFSPPPLGAVALPSSKQFYPAGYDGVLSNPVRVPDLAALLDQIKADKCSEAKSSAILVQ